MFFFRRWLIVAKCKLVLKFLLHCKGPDSKRLLRRRKKLRVRNHDTSYNDDDGNGKLVHECPKCNRRYKHSNNLRRHSSKCTGTNENMLLE